MSRQLALLFQRVGHNDRSRGDHPLSLTPFCRPLAQLFAVLRPLISRASPESFIRSNGSHYAAHQTHPCHSRPRRSAMGAKGGGPHIVAAKSIKKVPWACRPCVHAILAERTAKGMGPITAAHLQKGKLKQELWIPGQNANGAIDECKCGHAKKESHLCS